jgi:hypothetical protein
MTAIGRVIAGAGFGIGVALLLVACIGGPDCGAIDEIRSYTSAAPERIVLDGAHPVAEQRVTVHLSAEALPTHGSFDARLYVLRADETDASPTPAPSNASSDPPFSTVQVTAIREDIGAVIPVSAPWEESVFNVGRPFATIPLDCPAGSDCDRAYRIRIAMSDASTEAVPVAWSLQTRVTYGGTDAPCGIPSDARTDIETTAPVLLPATRVTTATPVGREEVGGPVIVRQITLSTDHAPTSASLRLSIARAGLESEQNPAWRQWIRVMEVGGGEPLADALVGASPYTATAAQGGTLDVPVLADCPEAAPCEREYRLIFQSFAAAPRWAGWGPDTPPPSLGAMTWSASAIGTYDEGVGAGALSLAIDGSAPGDSPAPPIASASKPDVSISDGAAPTALDVRFDVPRRAAQDRSIDPSTSSFAVVHVQASGKSLQIRLDEDGTGTLSGYVNGDGTINLIAHPLDACPQTGPCSAVVTLLAGGATSFVPHGRGSGVLDVSVDLIDAPPGSTISVGEPHVLSSPSGGAGQPIAPLAIVALIGLLLVVLAVALRRRRA